MLKDLIKHVADATDLTQKDARSALGIVVNAAERQGSPFITTLYKKMPGARTLSAKTNDAVAGSTGVIARLIEQTPGGRMAVTASMIRELQKTGLGHKQIGALFPAISQFMSDKYGVEGFGNLGDLLGAGIAMDVLRKAA